MQGKQHLQLKRQETQAAATALTVGLMHEQDEILHSAVVGAGKDLQKRCVYAPCRFVFEVFSVNMLIDCVVYALACRFEESHVFPNDREKEWKHYKKACTARALRQHMFLVCPFAGTHIFPASHTEQLLAHVRSYCPFRRRSVASGGAGGAFRPRGFSPLTCPFDLTHQLRPLEYKLHVTAQCPSVPKEPRPVVPQLIDIVAQSLDARGELLPWDDSNPDPSMCTRTICLCCL